MNNTPLLAIDYTFRGKQRRLFAKSENLNMTGSVKDRMALHLLKCASGDEVLFYALYPLHPGEMELKLGRGTEELEDLLEKREAPFVVDPTRPDVTRRRGFLGRFF